MELTRRWILLAAAVLAVWTAKLAFIGPLVTFRAADFSEAQKDESPWTDQGRRLAQLPLEQYIGEKTKGKVLDVSGEAWSRFLGDVLAGSRGVKKDKIWTTRVEKDVLRWELTPYRVFFRPEEDPVREIAGDFTKDEERRYLRVDTGGRPEYLEVSYQTYDADSFGFGSGFTGSPEPPTRFLFPLRKYSLWIAFLGLAMYVLLPRSKHRPKAIYYQTWRVILGDVAAMILFVPFFAIPIFVIGGSVQALTIAWPLTLVMWPLAFVGIWLLRLGAWYASYELLTVPEGIELSTYKERRVFRFAEMAFFQPIVVKPPRWLVIASWLGVLAGKGSARIGQTGRALILGASASNGIGVGLKDKSSAFFWVTDQMGGKALKNAERMIEALVKAGIPGKDEPKVISSITLPVGEDTRGRTIREGGGKTLAVLFLLPLVFLLLASLYVMFGRHGGKASSGVGSGGEGGENASARTRPVSDAAAVWVRTFSRGDLTLGRAILSTGDGGFAVAGSASGGDMNLDFFMAKVDGGGSVQWEKTYPGEFSDYGEFVCPAGEGGYFLAGFKRKMDDYLGGSMDVRLIRTSADGTLLWEKSWGKDEQDERPLALAPLAGGGCRLLVRTPNGASAVEWDGGGTVVREETVPLLGQFDDLDGINAAAFAPDGGFVLTGEEKAASGGFVDAFIARFDARGTCLWKRTSGGPGKESGTAVIALRDGGFAAAGVINLFDQDGEDVYVLRTDANGEVESEHAHGGPGDQSGEALIEIEGGALLVVGKTKRGEDPSAIFLQTAVRGGTGIEDKSIAGGGYGAWGTAVASAADGGIVIAADRTTSGFGTMAFDLLKIARK